MSMVILEKKGGIGTVTLNRPERLNALSRQLVAELLVALGDVARDDAVKVVVLRGAGRAFCAGVDLKEYSLGGGKTADLGFSGLWEAVDELPKPVIAAVHGYAVTGGFILVYCSDIVIATEDARFADSHARWGLIPSGGETQRLPRRVGMQKAKEIMFTSDLYSARDMERLGLVNRVVPASQLDEAVQEMAQKLLRNSTRSISTIKTLINRGMEMGFGNGLLLEARTGHWGKANAEPDPERDRLLGAFLEGRAGLSKHEEKG